MSTWLLLDCNYLARRAYHAMGGLKFDDMATGVIFGFFKDVISFQDLFGTDKIVFCWDGWNGLREQAEPSYKATRRAKQEGLSDEEKSSIEEFRTQVKQLRILYLYNVGYRNIFWAEGYEADDIIGSVAKHSVPDGDDVIIISSDQDYFQLLKQDQVIFYSPSAKKTVTEESFTQEYGVTPQQWVEVKAIAGCTSDNVVGVGGVGEITAAKYLRGMLKPQSKAHKAIEAAKNRIAANRKLVQLPYEGCPAFTLSDDDLTYERWENTMNKLGFRSLAHDPPASIRQRRPIKKSGLGF